MKNEKGQLERYRYNKPNLSRFQIEGRGEKSQSRNNNKELKHNYNSIHSTQDGTPGKDNKNLIIQSDINYNTYNKQIQTGTKMIENYGKNGDDSLSKLSELLNKQNLNFSGLKNKLPNVNNEENFLYDQILFNKSSINRAKILSHKMGMLKLPVSKIGLKPPLPNYDIEQKSLSDRGGDINKIKIENNIYKSKKKHIENDDDISCCCFKK